MGQLGLGVMIRMLGGNRESVEAITGAIGKAIKSVAINSDELRFRFTDGTGIKLWDNGQSCCENRYMRTDDDLSHFVGATLLGAEVRDAASIGDDEVHEVQFLIVKTSQGEFTCSNHNEHNGYYGGFSVEAAKLGDEA